MSDAGKEQILCTLDIDLDQTGAQQVGFADDCRKCISGHLSLTGLALASGDRGNRGRAAPIRCRTKKDRQLSGGIGHRLVKELEMRVAAPDDISLQRRENARRGLDRTYRSRASHDRCSQEREVTDIGTHVDETIAGDQVLCNVVRYLGLPNAEEIDAALDVADDLGYLKNADLAKLGEAMINCFKMLTGLINSQSKGKG